MAARQAKRAREAREKAEATAAERRSERDRWQRDAHAASAERQKQAEAAFERFEEARRRADALAQDEARAEARARYLAAWVALAPRADGAGALSASEVPWPSRVTPSAGRPLALDEVALHVLSPEMDAAARRRALTTELRRWHPDKFVSRWGARLLHAERDDVLAHVKQVSQCLTELLSK
jgi:NF-kappa-B inhibitor-like protein 1